MTCADCTASAQGPRWVFRAGCRGCKARAVARSPDFFRCRVAGRQDKDYRALLARVGLTHDEVLAARQADRQRPAA